MKNKLIILTVIIMINLIFVSSLAAQNIRPVNLNKLEEKTIISNYDLDFKIGDDMEVLYFEVKDSGESLFGYGYVKNTSNKTIRDGNFEGHGITGYNEDDIELFSRGVGTAFEVFIKPGEIIPIRFSYNYSNNEEVLKHLHVIEYRKDYNQKDINKKEGLYLNDIQHEVYINFELKNKTNDKFFSGNDTNVLLMFFNENEEIIGWLRGNLNDTLVPNSTQSTGSTFMYLNEEYKEGSVGIKNDFLNFLKNKGSIKIYSRTNISDHIKEKFNIKN